MKPSVGRIVHFYSNTIADKNPAQPGYGLNGRGAGPYPAIVSQVFTGGDYANLKVLGSRAKIAIGSGLRANSQG